MTTMRAQRVGTVRYLLADITTSLFGPEHRGADTGWITALREAGPASRAAIPHPAKPPARRPIAALTAEPHREIDDPHLGVLHVAGQVPAHLHNALARARNLPSLLDPKDPA
ncbi:hypothetical protein [Micromonospora chersina]|uniref:hypothetical protein n=1 Tax=Micromonospora chersina TaxID=47854 RepID=UPI0034034A97